MADVRSKARAEFLRAMLVITLVGIAMVVGALWYLSLYGPLYPHMVIATVAGVFLSVLLGSGLFAAAFFSDKSGHDRNVSEATQQDRHR